MLTCLHEAQPFVIGEHCPSCTVKRVLMFVMLAEHAIRLSTETHSSRPYLRYIIDNMVLSLYRCVKQLAFLTNW